MHQSDCGSNGAAQIILFDKHNQWFDPWLFHSKCWSVLHTMNPKLLPVIVCALVKNICQTKQNQCNGENMSGW